MNNSQKGAAPLPVLLALAGIVGLLAIFQYLPVQNRLNIIFPKIESHAAISSNIFSDTFDGNPAAPQPFINLNQDAWDIAIHSRNPDTWNILPTMKAHHGPGCEPPIDSNNNLVTHQFDGSYEQAVFKCKDHIMTSLNGIGDSIHDGYALIYLTPNALLDLSQGETIIRFDMTTLYQGRDWVDIWITPFDENLQLPFSMGEVDLQNWPRNAIQLELINANGAGMGFIPRLYSNFQEVDMGERGWTISAYDQWLTPSPQRRDTFEIRVSKTKLSMCMPSYNKCFFQEKNFPATLNWNKAVIQIGHHSYTPDKDNQFAPEPCRTDKSFCANTWHWDNFFISPVTPFTIIKGNKRMIASANNTVEFNQPAPAGAKLRFSGTGAIQVSYDGGITWQTASGQPAAKMVSGGSSTNGHMASYFINIPEGTKQVRFRTANLSPDQFIAKDFAIWSETAPSASPPPASNSPSAAASPNPSPRKPGDVDGNNIVNIFDYNEVLTNFGKTSGFNIFTDFDGNGRVDIFDYNLLLTNFGK